MKTILISIVGLMFGTTIFTNNDSLDIVNLRFDICEEDIYQDLLNL